jgi:hypothetical protein
LTLNNYFNRLFSGLAKLAGRIYLRHQMNAIREIKDVESGQVKVTLPEDFTAKKVEIIILPAEELHADLQTLQELLLEAPTLTEEELKEYELIRDRFKKRNVEEY